MISLVTAIFIASILGSFHCAGMCGAFVALAGGEPGGPSKQSPRDEARRQFILQGAYHAGRLVSYTALGAAAGATGRLINVAGALAGVRPVAAALAGGAMVVFALFALLRSGGIEIRRLGLPESWLRLLGRGHRLAAAQPPIVRAASIGLLTTMLPCGWLYAFAVTAAGTGSAPGGAAAMVAFWAGTLPALVAVGAGIRGVLGPLGRRLPALTILLMLGAGLYTLTAHAALNPLSLVNRVESRSAAALPPREAPVCCTTHDARH